MDTAAADLARKRWAKARRTNKTCPFCAQTFRGVDEQVYCTPKHQQAAATRRVREKRRDGAPPPPPQPPSKPDVNLGLARALYEVEVCRAAGDEENAARWEQIAAGIAQSAEAT